MVSVITSRALRDVDTSLLHHAARQMPRALPGVAVVALSDLFSLPWQQIGYVLGALMIVLQGCYTVWQWRKAAREEKWRRRFMRDNWRDP